MKALFKHGNGRLKTSRITFLVFIVMLVCLSLVYKMGKSADKAIVKIEHVFKAQKKEVRQLAETTEPPVKYPAPEKKAENRHPVKKNENIKVKKDLQPEKKVASTSPSGSTTEKTVRKNQRVKEKVNISPEPAEKKQIKFTMAQDLSTKKKDKTLHLASKDYFEVYKHWQAQGETMDKGKTLVGVRILNLENVYDLFQMKPVAVKEDVPHTDLEDNSRVASASLSEFSSTCFVVTNPWEKWEHALKQAGFSKKNNIAVRYYTYDFVRNSIYARALKAFEWSVEKQNLPDDTDPSTADVLGVVYAVNKNGGGSFGVFVPKQVDFNSNLSVKIDPMACFKGQKDIETLNRAGIL
ncbi:MAG: hypothetical protein GY699_02760 [Desulfobacteraceae bacterium]|nr:hypothetical protein [Desulfobacteraceae bacterium]